MIITIRKQPLSIQQCPHMTIQLTEVSILPKLEKGTKVHQEYKKWKRTTISLFWIIWKMKDPQELNKSIVLKFLQPKRDRKPKVVDLLKRNNHRKQWLKINHSAEWRLSRSLLASQIIIKFMNKSLRVELYWRRAIRTKWISLRDIRLMSMIEQIFLLKAHLAF